MAKPIPPKLEPLRASDLSKLSEEARRLFVQRSAQTQPGFAFELSKSIPTWSLFQEAYERGYSRNHRCAFDNALASGNLSLARVWGVRKAKAKGSDLRSHHSWPSVKWHESIEHVHKSPASDQQAWRARSWILAAIDNKNLDSLSTADLQREAISAFCAGRPALGLLCCRELAKHPSEALAKATASSNEWPTRLTPDLWAKAGQSPYEYRRATEPRGQSHSFEDDPANIPPPLCPLLSHVDFWASATSETQPELSKSLRVVHDALWNAGSFASPKNHARLFASSPYGASDPRAVLCEAASLGLALEKPGYHLARPSAEQKIYSEILLHCCAYPGDKLDPAKAWDGFLAAHPGAAHAKPNPFARVGATSCALLSLCGDGELIQLGLDRGYAPGAAAWILAKPGAMGEAYDRKALPTAAIERSPASFSPAIAPSGFAIHEPAWQRGKKKPAPPAALACPEGLPKNTYGKDDASAWRYQSLASVALACGKTDIARALALAGAPSGDFVQVLAETPLSKRHAVAEIAAAIETEALFDSTGGASAKPSTKRNILRV